VNSDLPPVICSGWKMVCSPKKNTFRKIMTQLNMQDIQDYAMAVPKRKTIMEALQMEVN
jgi:hypothetical protein